MVICTACCKRAHFGPVGGKAVSCKVHANADFVNVVSRSCERTGCNKRPHYGLEGGPARRCVQHMERGWVDVTAKHCDHDTCNKRPNFGPPGEAARRCAEHREQGWVNVVAKTCNHDGCHLLPSYGPEGGLPLRCVEHKEQDWVDVKSKCCEATGCTKQPSYAPEGEVARRCAQHRLQDWVDVKSRRCDHPSTCNRQPNYGPPGGSAHRCAQHVEPGYILLTRPVCKGPLCDNFVNNKAYKGYCFRCFCNVFPDNKPARNHKAKEHHVSGHVRQLLDSHPALQNINELARFDKQVDGGCSRKRPDVMLDCLTHVVIQETDEHQHEGYECTCEDKRMMQLFEDVGRRPLVLVRFNPDAYKAADGSKVSSCFMYHPQLGLPMVPTVRRAAWQQRLHVLSERLIHHVQTIPEREVTLEHLYYDGFHAL